MSRAVPDVPTGFASSNNRRAAVHRSQTDVVCELDMHAEHVAALERTLFRRCGKRQLTLVLSLEPEGFRIMSTATDRREPPES